MINTNNTNNRNKIFVTIKNNRNKIFVTIKIIIIIVLFIMSLINGDMTMVDTLLKTIVGCL